MSFAGIEELLSYISLEKLYVIIFYAIVTIMLVSFGVRSCICMQDLC